MGRTWAQRFSLRCVRPQLALAQGALLTQRERRPCRLHARFSPEPAASASDAPSLSLCVFVCLGLTVRFFGGFVLHPGRRRLRSVAGGGPMRSLR